jgi:Pentapeptide repeats (8 copies)
LTDTVLFEHVNLTGANLTDAKLRNVEFNFCILKGAKLSELSLKSNLTTNFGNTDFSGSNLTGSSFHQILFLSPNFQNASLLYSAFDKSYIHDADYRNAIIDSGKFTSSFLANADFRNAKLANADFTDSDLTNANFVGADLTGADFTGADFTGADFGDTEAPFGNGRVQPPQFLLPPLVFSPSYKIIDKHKLASYVIEGDVKMSEYLTSEEGIDSIAFLYNNMYYLIDKENLSNMIKSETNVEKLNNPSRSWTEKRSTYSRSK